MRPGGATVKNVDGNIDTDITAGVTVNAMGCWHLREVETFNKTEGEVDVYQRGTKHQKYRTDQKDNQHHAQLAESSSINKLLKEQVETYEKVILNKN